jgi:hypothetical protein
MEYKAKSRVGRSTFGIWYQRVDGCDVGEVIGVSQITLSVPVDEDSDHYMDQFVVSESM